MANDHRRDHDPEVVRFVEERQVEVHAHDAGEDDRRQEHGGQQGQDLHDVVRVLRGPAHVDVEGAEEQVAQVLDGVDVRSSRSVRPGHGCPSSSCERHVGPGERGERDPMRRERPPDQPDPPAERDDAGQDVVRGRCRSARSSSRSISRSMSSTSSR